MLRFTKTGSVKDQTEAAPNSGYYFLPLYDRGEYVLKVLSKTNKLNIVLDITF